LNGTQINKIKQKGNKKNGPITSFSKTGSPPKQWASSPANAFEVTVDNPISKRDSIYTKLFDHNTLKGPSESQPTSDNKNKILNANPYISLEYDNDFNFINTSRANSERGSSNK
jgi:hypothetical protein